VSSVTTRIKRSKRDAFLARSKERRGRPPARGDANVPDRLLAALEECLVERSYLDIGLREIAERAGTSHTMIGYYFVEKNGLFAALVERVLDTMIADLRRLRGDLRLHPLDPTRQLLHCMADHVSRHPEIARIAMTEAGRAGSEIGERIRLRHMPRILVACHGIVRDLIENKVYRSDLDRVFAVNALAGVATLGHITLPNLGDLGGEVNGFRSQRWIDFMTAALESQFM
jgi:TetR/AcrR family transcriptional regulator